MMIRVNLLGAGPAKPGKRRRARAAPEGGGGGAGRLGPTLLLVLPLAGGLGGSYYVHLRLADRIAEVQQATRTAEAEIAKLKPVLDEVERFKKDKALLEQKLAAFKSLEGARRGPTRIFDELAALMPRQVWVTAVREQGMNATIEALGLDSQSIAVFLNAMARSPYFTNVELTVVEQTEYLGLKIKRFSVTCRFQLPAEPAASPPATAASAAAPASATGSAR